MCTDIIINLSILCSLKQGLLQSLVSEPNKSVKSSIAQLMGGIVKHLKNVDKDWPELLQFFQNTITNNDPEQQEVIKKKKKKLYSRA
jgi:hypothetical protein